MQQNEDVFLFYNSTSGGIRCCSEKFNIACLTRLKTTTLWFPIIYWARMLENAYRLLSLSNISCFGNTTISNSYMAEPKRLGFVPKILVPVRILLVSSFHPGCQLFSISTQILLLFQFCLCLDPTSIPVLYRSRSGFYPASFLVLIVALSRS